MKKEKSKKVKLQHSVINNIIFLFQDMFKKYPLMILFVLFEIILSVITPIIGIYLPKIAVELVTNAATTEMVLYTLGGIGLFMAIAMALSNMSSQGKYFMYNGMRTFYRDKLFMKSLDCDYIHIESLEGQTKYSRARLSLSAGDWSGTSRLTVSTIGIIIAILSFIAYSSIISTLNILIIILLISLSLVNLIAVKKAQKYELSKKDDVAKIVKKMDYVEKTSSDWKWGKDIRIYGLSDWLLNRRNDLLNVYTVINNKIRKRYFAAGVINAFTLFLRDGISYGYLIWSVLNESINVGEFILYFGAITGFSGFVDVIINNINELNGANISMNDMRAFLDNTDSKKPESPAKLQVKNSFTIEFKNASFAYTKDSEPILNNFNMKIEPYEKIALVGINGAGKTTITKILCGFYKLTSGELLINGININDFNKKDVFSLVSVVFQDVCILPFTVAENISMIPLDKTDLSLVNSCLKKVGLLDEIGKYPEKEKSFMLKSVKDGIVLSGGQQQKLLMARALYKDAPILILDEPTAALDPIAESETYEQFHSVAKDKTSIYISHRLASTKFCDKIVFLDNGIALEVGTHNELMELEGEYANMFSVQSHYYKEEVDTI